uniref:Methylenetetrahydrofolate dehydrogenase (NADP+ dependent) 2 like n=1 Tax=Apteryx owenii TaxID=8824 RepID=A0A8B9Q5M5_APTOW
MAAAAFSSSSVLRPGLVPLRRWRAPSRPAPGAAYSTSSSPRSAASDEATIISGTKLAKQVLKEIQRDVESWISFGNKRPHLTVILVGDNPASHIYVRNKIKAAASVGDATVTITHRYTPKEQLKIHTQLADIVVVAAGIPKLITTDMVKEGAAVIDVGINHIHDPLTGKTKLVGDVDFEVDYTEQPRLLKLMQACLEEHHSYCINGLCAFHNELRKPICKCLAGYNGERCEHLTLNSYAHNSYERYIAVGIGIGILTSGILAIIYCYVRKRCRKLKSPYKVCLGETAL